MAETREVTKADALRPLIAAERSSSIFKRLGIWFKGKDYVTMDCILVPDDPNDHTQHGAPSSKHKQSLKPSLRRGRIISIKLPKHHSCWDQLWRRSAPACDAVLSGTFDLEEIAEITEVRNLIEGMRYPDPSNPTPTIETRHYQS
jgi:hypothetical protein